MLQGPGTSPSIDSPKPNLPTSAELFEQIERVMHIPREDLTRRHFYPIRRLFLQLALVEGWQATIERAATLIEALVDHRQWEAIAADHDKTLQTLLDVSKQEPTTFLDEHIADLAAGRLAAAIKGFGRIQTETLSNFSKYRQILEDGPERGLTVWQVMNPFYYIWSTLPIVGQKVSERWKETGFNNSVDAEALVRSPLSKNEKLLAAIVRAKCKDIDWSSARVLECGTGNGANAALFLGEVGVAPSNYFGFDLHPSRVESTRSVIRLVATGDTDSEGLDKRIFELDILADTAADTLRKLASIDVLFSASFTNVFDDSQISKVLDHISVLAPKYIVDVSVITSWALCFGRHDLSDHYDSIGYQLSGSQFETPVISGDEGYRIWLPEKAWANRNILVYERARF